ncbi:hypothetical protein Tco_0390731 [Tanacetum coccineum]
MLVRQAYTSTITDTESEPIEDPIKTKEPQPLPITSTPIPSPDYTPATPYSDEESEDSETSETRITSPHSTTPPSEFTSPLSPINPLSTQTSLTLTPSRAFYYRSTTRIAVRTHPTLSSGILARVTEAMTLSPLSFRKRYRGTFKPIVDTETEGDELEDKGTDSESEELEDEGLGSGSDEVASKDQSTPDQQIADETPTPRLHVCITWEDPKDDPLLEAPILPSPVATPVSDRTVNEGYLAELRAHLKLHGDQEQLEMRFTHSVLGLGARNKDRNRLRLLLVLYGNQFWPLRSGQDTQTPKEQICSMLGMRIRERDS